MNQVKFIMLESLDKDSNRVYRVHTHRFNIKHISGIEWKEGQSLEWKVCGPRETMITDHDGDLDSIHMHMKSTMEWGMNDDDGKEKSLALADEFTYQF